MRILVTAFEPFGGEAENPTHQILPTLHGVETLLLPVSYEKAPALTLQKIREYNPEAVILLGQAGGRAAISLERVAVNIADANNPDNDGFIPVEQPVSKNGLPALLCTLPLRKLRDMIQAEGVPCHISNSAGTYVCNTLYYKVMESMPHLSVLFVHVPYSPRQAVTKSLSTPSMNLSDMTTAITTILTFLHNL